MRKIKRLVKEETIQSIRNHMLAFGYDLSNISDEELGNRVTEFYKTIKSASVSLRNFAGACKRISSAGIRLGYRK